MKRSLRLAVALTVALALSAAACTSTATYKAAGIGVATVDLAMKSWGEWVTMQKRAGTPVPLPQEEAVRKAHDGYLQSIDVAEKATLAYYLSESKDPKALRAIIDAVVQAGISVVTVINSYRVGAPPIPVPHAEELYREVEQQAFWGRIIIKKSPVPQKVGG